MPLLKGWKQIAAFLGVCENTAKRYCLEDRLPIHRPSKSTIVYAEEVEIISWVKRRSGSRMKEAQK